MSSASDDMLTGRPYCGAGCGQFVYDKEGKLISIEGERASPIS